MELIVATANPSRIYVFGSWAKGEASVDSDIDIAVFLPDSMTPIGSDVEDRLLEVLDELRIFGFHAQQSVEKLMKALLEHLGTQYALTHNLTMLSKLIAHVDQPLPNLGIPLRKLTRFGVVYRYEFTPLSANPDRRIVREAVRLLRDYVLA